ncbi:MAG: polyketide synthase dehydratase domain-containing protein, partial [Myxococcota bacterium]
EPTLYADLLCTVDGLKAFYCRRMGLRLVPDWPLEEILSRNPALLSSRTDRPIAEVDGFRFDHHSLLACAWGRPSHAFGPMYRRFDSAMKVARLPSPPYHFMTRVAEVEGAIGGLEVGSRVVVEYDIPADAWYFEEGSTGTMPFCVLLEAALQPCGWLASYVGCAARSDLELRFRNLDGTATPHFEIGPDAGTLRTSVTNTAINQSGGMTIISFAVECDIDGRSVYSMTTVFGFFPPEALANQVGLPVPAAEANLLTEGSDLPPVELRVHRRYFEGGPRLPASKLLMIERVTGRWPEGGPQGLGRYRSGLDVDRDAWFLKAHFFQDPVQPGSLGIEAMIQLLQFAMLDQGLDEGLGPHARFEPIATARPVTWKYRGQVTPERKRVECVVDITARGEDDRGRFAVADAALYADGLRIYEAKGLAMRIVTGRPQPSPESEREIDLTHPEHRHWLDHCPTYAVPALPLMSMVAAMAEHAPDDGVITAIEDVQVERWLPLSAGKPTRIRIDTDEHGVTHLSAWRDAPRAALSRFEPVAHARIRTAPAFESSSASLDPLEGPLETVDGYAHLFHGPAFQRMESLSVGRNGARAWLRIEPEAKLALGSRLPQVLLDAATHPILHDRLHRWSEDISPDLVAYPYRIDDMRFFGPLPSSGHLQCEVRFLRRLDERLVTLFVALFGTDEQPWCTFRLTEVLVPKGQLGAREPSERRRFLAQQTYVPGMRLSRTRGDNGHRTTELSDDEVRRSNWLPSTLETVYDVAPGAPLTEAIAVKEHVAARAEVHPATVHFEAEPTTTLAWS